MRVEPIENIAPSSQPVVRKCCASGAVGLAEDVVPWDEKRMPKMLRSGNRNCCGRMLRVLGMSNGRDVALPGTHRWAGACDSGTWSRRTRAGKCCAKMLRRGRVLDARRRLTIGCARLKPQKGPNSAGTQGGVRSACSETCPGSNARGLPDHVQRLQEVSLGAGTSIMAGCQQK